MSLFDSWRKKFDAMGALTDAQRRDLFVSNARSIVRWGGSGRLGILNSWPDVNLSVAKPATANPIDVTQSTASSRL